MIVTVGCTCTAEFPIIILCIVQDLERARVSAYHPDLIETWDETVRTVADAFLKGVEISG